MDAEKPKLSDVKPCLGLSFPTNELACKDLIALT